MEPAEMPSHGSPTRKSAMKTVDLGMWGNVGRSSRASAARQVEFRLLRFYVSNRFPSGPRAQPYFYSHQEIRELLNAAKTRPSIDPLRPWTYYCLFGLLAVTGLQLGEALNLRIGDIDWSEDLLTIRGAKFGKSRLVPLHASTCKVLADYAKRRDRRFGGRTEGPFLVNKNGNQLDKGEVHRAFYPLSRQIGLRGVGDSRGPRLHDFRHRFAV